MGDFCIFFLVVSRSIRQFFTYDVMSLHGVTNFDLCVTLKVISVRVLYRTKHLPWHGTFVCKVTFKRPVAITFYAGYLTKEHLLPMLIVLGLMRRSNRESDLGPPNATWVSKPLGYLGQLFIYSKALCFAWKNKKNKKKLIWIKKNLHFREASILIGSAKSW